MNLLLDTNVLSEVRRPAPDPTVLAWLDTVDEDRTFISVASIAELRRGIALMDDGRRREALTAWLAEDLPARFAGRILPIKLGIEVLKAGRHLRGLDRGNVLLGQIDGPNGPTIAPGSTGFVGRRRPRLVLFRVTAHDAPSVRPRY